MAGDVAAVIGAAMAFFLISIAAGMAVIAAPEQRSQLGRLSGVIEHRGFFAPAVGPAHRPLTACG